MATIHSSKAVYFFDTKGDVVKVLPLSWTKRSEFVDTYKFLLDIVAKSPNTPIGDLFEENNDMQSLCLKCLEIAKVDVNDLALEQIIGLLFPINEDQEEGLLISQNFPNISQKEKLLPKSAVKAIEDVYASNIENLWAATEDLEQAIQLAEEIPADMLNKILDLRAERLRKQLPPDERGKLEAKELLARRKAERADLLKRQLEKKRKLKQEAK